MNISEVHKWEQAIVQVLNFDDWELEWCGGKYEHYDAKGKTPKGFDCVVEMKFRQKYYETKMLEKYKYDQLMSMPKEIVKLYFVNDPKANYMYWLNNMSMPKMISMYCPDTTLWTKQRKDKDVYLLEESQSTITNYNSSY